MQRTLALLALAASASATIVDFMAAMPLAERDVAALVPRQTPAASTPMATECLSAAQQMLTSMPTPPPEIQSELVKHPQTDPCSFTTPASLSKEFAQFSSQFVSWASKHQDMLTACAALSRFNTVASCTTSSGADAASKTAAAAAGAATPTGGSAPNKSANAGARETGIAMAAALAAAGLAVVAL